MCRCMVEIQYPTAEIRRGKKKKEDRKKKPQSKNIMSASATQGGHKKNDGTKNGFWQQLRDIDLFPVRDNYCMQVRYCF